MSIVLRMATAVCPRAPDRRRRSTAGVIFCCSLLTLMLSQVSHLMAQEDNKATAPPDHSIIRGGRGGSYFVPNELFREYESLSDRIRLLQSTVSEDTPDVAGVQRDLVRLQQELEVLQQQIENAQVFVSPVSESVQTDIYEFELGPDRCVVLVADDVRVRSWDGDRIRCELRKSILASDKPSEEQFAAIHVEHELGPATDYVGQTSEARAESERQYQQSPDVQEHDEVQRAGRAKLVFEIDEYWQRYSRFQGKAVNLLRVTGLTAQEGNEHMTISVNSEGGTGRMGGHWRRAADLTLYLPRNVQLAVLGCQSGVDIQGVEGSVLLTADHSHDRDYHGEFSVDGVSGDLTIYDAPIRAISHIGGAVRIDAMGEMRNGGNHHSGGERRKYVDRSSRTVIQGVAGNLTAEYLVTDLLIEEVAGSINVTNRHGTTELTIASDLSNTTHRVMSVCGAIRIHGPAEIMHRTPWYLFSQIGEIRTNLPRSVLDDVSFTSGESWSGFVPAPDPDHRDFSAMFERMQRPEQVLADTERSLGFDVLTRSGTISLKATDQEGGD